VDDVPYTGDLDLASVTTQGELAELLRIVHVRADRSLRALEAQTRRDSHPVSKTVISEMLRGLRFPKKTVMLSFLRACGVPADDADRWSRAWERLADPSRGFGLSPVLRANLPENASTETAIARPTADIVNADFELLRGQIDKLDADNRRLRQQLAKQSAWWRSYDLSYEDLVGLEADALVIRAFQSSVVHGLLQTAEYARAGHEGAIPRFSPKRIETQVEAKLIRQTILDRDNPPRLDVVLDEAALHRMVGGRLVMAAQLVKVLKMSALPNVIIQVLPFERGEHPGLETNFTILELPDPAHGVVYVEGLMGPIYLKDPNDLRRSHEVFKRLQSIALSPEETTDWIRRRQLEI
jgi:hypothetical protein